MTGATVTEGVIFKQFVSPRQKRQSKTFIKKVADLEEVKFLSSVVCSSKADFWITIVKVDGRFANLAVYLTPVPVRTHILISSLGFHCYNRRVRVTLNA